MRKQRRCRREDRSGRDRGDGTEIAISPEGCDRYERDKKRQYAESGCAERCRVVIAFIKDRQTFIENVGPTVGSRARQVGADRHGQTGQRGMLLLVCVRAAIEQLDPRG